MFSKSKFVSDIIWKSRKIEVLVFLSCPNIKNITKYSYTVPRKKLSNCLACYAITRYPRDTGDIKLITWTLELSYYGVSFENPRKDLEKFVVFTTWIKHQIFFSFENGSKHFKSLVQHWQIWATKILKIVENVEIVNQSVRDEHNVFQFEEALKFVPKNQDNGLETSKFTKMVWGWSR